MLDVSSLLQQCTNILTPIHVNDIITGAPPVGEPEPPRHATAYTLLRLALLNHGLDCAKLHGWVSAAHSEQDIDDSITAYRHAFQDLVEEKLFG
jgi:hypothetical protein